jgi:hypothetical protein
MVTDFNEKYFRDYNELCEYHNINCDELKRYLLHGEDIRMAMLKCRLAEEKRLSNNKIIIDGGKCYYDEESVNYDRRR